MQNIEPSRGLESRRSRACLKQFVFARAEIEVRFDCHIQSVNGRRIGGAQPPMKRHATRRWVMRERSSCVRKALIQAIATTFSRKGYRQQSAKGLGRHLRRDSRVY